MFIKLKKRHRIWLDALKRFMLVISTDISSINMKDRFKKVMLDNLNARGCGFSSTQGQTVSSGKVDSSYVAVFGIARSVNKVYNSPKT